MRIPKDVLAKFSLFENVSQPRRNEIAEMCHWQRLLKNQTLAEENDLSTEVFFLVSGVVIAKSYSSNGKEVTYVEVGNGEVFGEFSAIDQKPRSASLVAAEESFVGRMIGENFRQLIVSEPKFAMALTLKLVEKNRSFSRRVYESSVLSVKHRVSAELLRLEEESKRKNCKYLMPTHQMFASRIGTHREAVSREISHLTSSGVLKTNAREIEIIQRNVLHQLADI